MDAERRHELQENDLARFLGKFTQQLQEKGSRMALLAGGVALVIVLFWVLRTTRAASQRDDWARYQEAAQSAQTAATTPGSDLFGILSNFEAVAVTASEPILAMRAYGSWGQAALVYVLTAESDGDKKALNEEARRAFEGLQKAYGANPIARGIALCGLATVEENAFVFDGDMGHKEKMRRLLEQVRDDGALTGYPPQAEALRRLNTLDRIFVQVTFPAKAPEPPPATTPAAESAGETSETSEAAASESTTSGEKKATGSSDAGSGTESKDPKSGG